MVWKMTVQFRGKYVRNQILLEMTKKFMYHKQGIKKMCGPRVSSVRLNDSSQDGFSKTYRAGPDGRKQIW